MDAYETAATYQLPHHSATPSGYRVIAGAELVAKSSSGKAISIRIQDGFGHDQDVWLPVSQLCWVDDPTYGPTLAAKLWLIHKNRLYNV